MLYHNVPMQACLSLARLCLSDGNKDVLYSIAYDRESSYHQDPNISNFINHHVALSTSGYAAWGNLLKILVR